MRHVYILHCSDDTLYTWITTDLERRINEHNTSDLGAKYTKFRRPVSLAWSQAVASRAEANAYEYRIKRMTKEKKRTLIQGNEAKK
jgi:putative endonuclease